MKATEQRPVEKLVVLVGAGNAHLVFVKRFGMRPLPGVAVTLVNEASVIPYSAMVPGHIGGDYTWDEITIDLVRLCRSVGVRFVAGRVTGLDPATRQVTLADRPPLAYDALSFGLGSLPAGVSSPEAGHTDLVMRPLGQLVQKLSGLETQLARGDPLHLVVVGGGASGCELALAIHKRLSHHTQFRMTLLQGGERLLPEFPAKVARLFQQALEGRGVVVRLNARVTGGARGSLVLDSGEQVPLDVALWATNAAPPPVLAGSHLALDAGGFLLVTPTLQTVADPAVFGTGDCVAFPAYPDLARNGVHAVRQGRVLYDNVLAFLQEHPLRPFRPQRRCLSLLNTSDGDAVLSYGPLAWKGRWARRLKDRIDRAWVEKFTVFPAMNGQEGEAAAESRMRCGGCGSKISGDVLSAVLPRIDIAGGPRLLLGCRAGEDAAVFRTGADGQVEVQTVDYFKAFVDDPYLFGRVAALNAVSDLYAMNARPFSALAIATLPHARGPVQEAQLYELLAGAAQSLRTLGVVLTGGHTAEGSEMA